MGSNGSASVFTPAAVAAAPEDPLFGLMKAYREDPFEKKVDLGIGAYRDNNAKPWILPVVKKVRFGRQESSVTPSASAAAWLMARTWQTILERTLIHPLLCKTNIDQVIALFWLGRPRHSQ